MRTKTDDTKTRFGINIMKERALEIGADINEEERRNENETDAG